MGQVWILMEIDLNNTKDRLNILMMNGVSFHSHYVIFEDYSKKKKMKFGPNSLGFHIKFMKFIE